MKRFLPLVLLFACTGTTEGKPDAEVPDVSGEDLGDAELDPTADLPARAIKRMSVAQVRASMQRVSGGIAWMDRSTDLWEKYSSTLGVPDYQESTEEDRSPGVMFHKFLDDAANYTCEAWFEAELDGSSDTFFVEAEIDEEDGTKIRANLAHLRRHIQGRALDTDNVDVDAYVELYDRVVTRTDDRASAWNTVCVAMFTHPDFYAY